MKIIFLDIDGVLGLSATFQGYLDDPCVTNFNNLVSESGAEVVLHSSWRYFKTLDAIQDDLTSMGVKAKLVDEAPRAPFTVKMSGLLVWHGKYEDWAGSLTAPERPTAIQKYLDAHPEVTHFVILDDDPNMAHLKDHHIRTIPGIGLTTERASLALNILKDGPT